MQGKYWKRLNQSSWKPNIFKWCLIKFEYFVYKFSKCLRRLIFKPLFFELYWLYFLFYIFVFRDNEILEIYSILWNKYNGYKIQPRNRCRELLNHKEFFAETFIRSHSINKQNIKSVFLHWGTILIDRTSNRKTLKGVVRTVSLSQKTVSKSIRIT